MKKRTRLTACLVAGVLILSVSAFAAFDSVSGYARYKTAAKALLLQTDNVTVSYTASIRCDGEELTGMEGEIQKDGGNRYTHSLERYVDGDSYENYEDIHGNTNSYYTVGNTENGQPVYYVDEKADPVTGNLAGTDMSDETNSRLVAFVEIAADTVVGDLKNNFVQVGAENGVDTYRVDIDETQVPALVSAGLSLYACSQADSNSGECIIYDKDWTEMCIDYYELTTGETLPAAFRTTLLGDSWDEMWYAANEEQIDKVYEKGNELDELAWKVLEEKGDEGTVYLYADGTYDYYADRQSFLTAHPEQREMTDAVGSEMTLQHITCEFSVDKAGNLLRNSGEAVFYTSGSDGKGHEFTVSFQLTCSDYGTTEARHIDTTGLTKVDVTYYEDGTEIS